jgi:hypothetical protein
MLISRTSITQGISRRKADTSSNIKVKDLSAEPEGNSVIISEKLDLHKLFSQHIIFKKPCFRPPTRSNAECSYPNLVMAERTDETDGCKGKKQQVHLFTAAHASWLDMAEIAHPCGLTARELSVLSTYICGTGAGKPCLDRRLLGTWVMMTEILASEQIRNGQKTKLR